MSDVSKAPIDTKETPDTGDGFGGAQVAEETPDMADGFGGAQVAEETPDMAPKPDGPEYRDENGNLDITEWIVSSCTGFFSGDEETIRSFGENPEAWCGTNLPPDCGPQDISRCMPEILDRCGQEGGDSGSSQELARYCGSFSQNSSSTYHSSSSSSDTTYTSGSHCATDTVVNEICYTVNVYHQTNIYTHHEGSTTDCFGDRTPCTTTEIDEDFGCFYPEDVPSWDPHAPVDSWDSTTGTTPTPQDGSEVPGMAPPATTTQTQTQDMGTATEAATAAETIEMSPATATMVPGRADPKPDPEHDASTDPSPGGPIPTPYPNADAAETPTPAFGEGSVPETAPVPGSDAAGETGLDPTVGTTDPSLPETPESGFGQGAAGDPLPEVPVEADPATADTPPIDVVEEVVEVVEFVPEPVVEAAYEAPAEDYTSQSESGPDPMDQG